MSRRQNGIISWGIEVVGFKLDKRDSTMKVGDKIHLVIDSSNAYCCPNCMETKGTKVSKDEFLFDCGFRGLIVNRIPPMEVEVTEVCPRYPFTGIYVTPMFNVSTSQSSNLIEWQKGSIVDNKQEKHACTCDLQTVLMVTGCKCGGY